MIADANSLLSALCAKLGEESLNYCPNIRLYSCPRVAGRSIADTVQTALGTAVVVGGTSPADLDALLPSLNEALGYAGDENSHPNLAFLASDEFRAEKAEVLRFFEALARDADLLTSFWLKEGHPFYPMFWAFAFVIEKGADSHVLIGSSSD